MQLEKTEFADDKSKLSDTITGIMALTGANSMKKKRQILLNASDSNGYLQNFSMLIFSYDIFQEYFFGSNLPKFLRFILH